MTMLIQMICTSLRSSGPRLSIETYSEGVPHERHARRPGQRAALDGRRVAGYRGRGGSARPKARLAAIASEGRRTCAGMRREMRERGRPGIGRLIFGIRGAMERPKGGEGGVFLAWLFLIRFFLEVFGNAERGADGDRSVAPRIGGCRDVLLEFVAGERRVEGRRKDRQQREQRQEDLRKAAMEAGLTQNEPLPTRQFQHFLHSRTRSEEHTSEI